MVAVCSGAEARQAASSQAVTIVRSRLRLETRPDQTRTRPDLDAFTRPDLLGLHGLHGIWAAPRSCILSLAAAAAHDPLHG